MLIKQSAGRNIGGVYLKIRLLIQFCLQRNFFVLIAINLFGHEETCLIPA